MLRKAYVPLLLLLLAVGLAAPLHAQAPEAPKYWVFFTDKGEATGEGETVSSVAITDRAEARRALRGRPDAPARLDVSVAPAYVAALEAMGIEPVIESRWFNAVSARLTPAQQSAVATLPFVRGLRPVAPLTAHAMPSLAPLAAPVGGFDYGPSLAQLQLVHADATLEAGHDGAGVRLGYLDALFDFTHPALAHVVADGRLIAVEDFTGGQPQSNYHGLSTTSVALGFDEGRLIGPAFASEVLAATTEYAPTETHQEEDFFVAGLEWLEANGADVVSVSLGYSTFDPGEGDYTYEDMDGDTAIVTRAVDRAAQLGVVVVTSAGNEGSDDWQYITAPADADSAITVAAVRLDGTRASFSSVGPTADGRIKPDVAALGVDVFLARSGAAYGFGNGTSFSAPMVAGIAAQILAADPSLGPIEVRDLLRRTAGQASAPDTLLGWGIANAEAALLVATPAEAVPPSARAWRLLPSVARPGSPLVAEVDVAAPGPLTLTLFDVLGRRVGTLYDGAVPSGRTRIPLVVPHLAPGAYFVRAAGFDLGVRRLTVLR